MDSQINNRIVQNYLELMDTQRETTFASLEGISPEQLWERPAPREWSIGEILHHNILLFRSMFPLLALMWWFRWTGKFCRNMPYKTEIDDPYRKPGYPHWEGFLWTPKFSKKNQIPFSNLIEETRRVHRKVRAFYEQKDEAVLGHIYFVLPIFGFFNLVQALQIFLYHDQLHYDDVIKQWHAFKKS